MAVSTAVLAFSINHSLFGLASLCIVLFVATFSIGLGPIPFVLMGELPPPEARSATASAALGTNWGLNFIIGLTFLPLRDFLSGGRTSGSGTIFYFFSIISAVGYLVMARRLRATTASTATAV
ncbi:BQ5605_C001g00620 [Microbotryum silenes-dioicae]|uniref:BQ5605_C001g00620 protein n=1 Tax=Microbotryum silenes-dioicae TaxID=796604 RepID=A0A2X0M3W4_9BASI|nr:BQ5605_C001g00620 [Microbotryum silenes-dioicae]